MPDRTKSDKAHTARRKPVSFSRFCQWFNTSPADPKNETTAASAEPQRSSRKLSGPSTNECNKITEETKSLTLMEMLKEGER